MTSSKDKFTRLGGEDSPSASSLKSLSDLSSEDRAALRELWPHFPPHRRLDIVSRLGTLCEDNIDLDFRYAFLIALDDADPDVRRAAIDGLFEDNSKLFLGRLLSILRSDTDDEVRETAARALSRFTYLAQCNKLNAPTADLRSSLLLIARNSDEDMDVRRRALEALGYFHEDKEVQTLVSEAYHRGGNEAESALFAMGRSMDTRWQPTILSELNNSSPAMRYEAAHAAGEMQLEDALPDLIRMMDDPDLEVRLSVAWALGQIGGKPAAEALAHALKSENRAMRDAAEEALQELAFSANPLNVL